MLPPIRNEIALEPGSNGYITARACNQSSLMQKFEKRKVFLQEALYDTLLIYGRGNEKNIIFYSL